MIRGRVEPGDDRCDVCGYTEGLHRSGCAKYREIVREARRVASLEVDPGEALAAGLDEGLREHRGGVWLDSRVHCLCGWRSERGDGDPAQRKDYRAHVVGAQVAAVAALLAGGKVSRRG